MLGGRKTQKSLGYTIIEVMIVLAVSGVMFVIAATFINGKQQRTAFTTGINETASEIQDVIEQVIDGRYSDVPLTCTYNTGGDPIISAGSATGQGTNSSCVFLGKLVRIPADSSNLNSYRVLSLASGRLTGSTANGNPDDGNPAVIAPNPNLTPTLDIPDQLNVVNSTVTAYDLGHGAHLTTAFGFVQSQGVSNGSNEFLSGAQTINLVYVPNIFTTSVDSDVNHKLQPASSVAICLTNGLETAEIAIGTGNDSQLSVNVQRLTPGTPCP